MSWSRPSTAERQAQRAAERERNLCALLQPPKALHRGSYEGGVTAAPKEKSYRDPVLLEMQRGRPCKFLAVSNCATVNGETTVACHENQGKGMGIKASDERSAGGCIACHSWYDTGIAPRAEKRRAFMAAHLRQVNEWRRISVDSAEPERFRNAACRALGRLAEQTQR